MTNEEATKIKNEILAKEGSLKVGTLTFDKLVKIDDVLAIINSHISGKDGEQNSDQRTGD